MLSSLTESPASSPIFYHPHCFQQWWGGWECLVIIVGVPGGRYDCVVLMVTLTPVLQRGGFGADGLFGDGRSGWWLVHIPHSHSYLSQTYTQSQSCLLIQSFTCPLTHSHTHTPLYSHTLPIHMYTDNMHTHTLTYMPTLTCTHTSIHILLLTSHHTSSPTLSLVHPFPLSYSPCTSLRKSYST